MAEHTKNIGGSSASSASSGTVIRQFVLPFIGPLLFCFGHNDTESAATPPGGISSNIFTDRFGTLMRVLASSHLVCMSETACGPPPVSYRRFSPEVNLSAPGDRMFHRSSKMDSESNKKRKLDNVGVGGQDVETVKAFDKPRAPLTATAGELKHSSQRLCYLPALTACAFSCVLQGKSRRCLMQ